MVMIYIIVNDKNIEYDDFYISNDEVAI